MIRDLLRLDTDTAVFYSQTMNDIEFINTVMAILAEKFVLNSKLLDREAEADNILDTEWKFNQLLNEISNNKSIFSPLVYPEMSTLLNGYRKECMTRQKKIEASYVPTEHSTLEPVVSNAELNGLLGNE